MSNARVVPQGEGLNGLPFRYRIRGLFYRAMMVAYFYDDEKFAGYAEKMFQQIEWGVLQENKAAA